MYVFCIYLRTNSDLCHLQQKLVSFYNRDEKCLQCGTDWVFKYSGLRFVLKGLVYSKKRYKLYYRQMVAQLRINEEMYMFHSFFSIIFPSSALTGPENKIILRNLPNVV